MQDINKLLKMHRQMADMMKSMSKGKGGLGKMFGLGGGGGMPDVSPEMVEQMKAGQMPAGMPKMPAGLPKGFGGLPGLPGGGFPGLPGLPGKKK